MGVYISETDLDAVFSAFNIDKYADLDADGLADAGRIDVSIAYAESLVEDRFRNGPYAVPLSFASTGAQAAFNDIVVKVAVWHLYTSRGMRDEKTVNKLQGLKDEAMALIDGYLSGRMRLNATLSHSGPTAPV